MTEPASPFEHGVASGDPLADRVVLWTRVSGAPARVRWVVAADPGLRDVVAEGSAGAEPGRDGTVAVDVRGLRPGTTYYYAFEALGATSPVGRTRTAPAGDPARLRLAVAACAKYPAGYFNAYARIAARDDIDAVLHLGDYTYQTGVDPRDPGPAIGRALSRPRPSLTLDDYRARHSLYKKDPDLQALHRRHPVIAIPDDNDICNGTWRDGAETHDPATQGEWTERKAAALSAFLEWVPVRVDHPGVLYRRLGFGSLADLYVLDDRTQRDEMTKTGEMDREGRTMLGAAQFGWLTEALDRSRAAWRLVANPVMIGQCHTDFLPEEVGYPLGELGVLTKREFGPDPDQWDGYPHERGRLIDHIAKIRDVVFVSGDVHSSWALELKRDAEDPNEAPSAVEFVTTSVTSQNLDERLGAPPRTTSVDIERIVDERNPHIKWLELDSHGYLTLDVTPERVRAEWWFVEGVRERTGGERLGAAWEVRRGETALRSRDVNQLR
ncbi:MAG: alkaline phosphatase D family protein [Actinomycetota bacterium]|nr:alkaline phosphatase D family protein [Actinomycetota bacterium]